MTVPRSLSVLFASDRLLPAVGGAELAALEVLESLAPRHDLRAAFLAAPPQDPPGFSEPPPGVALIPVAAPPQASGSWATQRLRREALGSAVEAALAERDADVVVTQLRSAPPVVDAASSAGVPTLLLLPSYESLCKNAFDADSRCLPGTRCRGCPCTAALDPSEAEELIAAREAHERSLAAATALVAPSRAVADACEQWCGRRPEVIAPVARAEAPVAPHPRGPILLVASRWIKNKGLDLLVPLCRGLHHREVWITEQGLSPGMHADLTRLDHVRLVGDPPMGRLLARAGVLLVPSRWPEPFGRVAFEGLAAGVPTLASAVGGLPEFVPTAQLVEPPDSVPAWVAAVRRLEDDASWQAARRDGIAAAHAVIRRAPLARLQAVILEVGESRRSRSERRRARVVRQEIERAEALGLSVPKAGRSWVCYFLARYVAERTRDPLDLDLLSGRALPPVVFVHEHLDVFEDVVGPARLLNEHLLMRRRIVVLVRDPRDSLVSYWHHKRLRERRPVPDRLERFADCPVYGIERLAQGTGLLLDLYDRHPGDRLLVTYEDLVSDPDRGLTRILRFLLAGAPVDDRARRAAIAASRFQRMRDWERSLTREEARLRCGNRFGPRDDAPTEDGHFKVRRGEVGGFVSEMSPPLRRHVASLPHTAALLERLAARPESFDPK